MKERRVRNVINDIYKEGGYFTNEKDEIVKELANYFKNLLDESRKTIDKEELRRMIDYKILNDIASDLTEEVDAKEIKDTLFVMNNNKAPVLNGFGVYFFKAAWEVIGEDFIKAIRHFFTTGHLLKEVNYRTFALMPKCATPSFCKDFRLITCYNVIYKCITKIMANHLKKVLLSFINQAQGTFVEGRQIRDNILFYQELFLWV